MDKKLEQLMARTNLDELVARPAPQMDFNQPVETAAPPKIDSARSTSDPLQIHFATTDIVGKLKDSDTGSGVKTFAFVFLGGPLILFGLGMVAMAWSNPELSPLRLLLSTVFGLTMAGFWPYIIFSNRRKVRRAVGPPVVVEPVDGLDTDNPYRAPSYAGAMDVPETRGIGHVVLSILIGVLCAAQFLGVWIAVIKMIAEFGWADAPLATLLGMALPFTLLLGGLFLAFGRRLAVLFFAAYLLQYGVEAMLRDTVVDVLSLVLISLFLGYSIWLWRRGKLRGWPGKS
jgi:hypothetical protein